MQRSLILLLVLIPHFAFAIEPPSRAAEKGCSWQRFQSAELGLEAWVQHCDYGFRKIDFVEQKGALAVRFSDGGDPEPLIDVMEMREDEDVAQALARIFKAGTDENIASRCHPAPFPIAPTGPGVERFTFLPTSEYQLELQEKAVPDEVPEPPCGPLGDAPDGIQYFEAHPAAMTILFIRLGQDTPLFDEKTLLVTKPTRP